MFKTLFWIIVVVCVIGAFPAIGVGAVVLVVLFFAACFLSVWTKDRREKKRLEEERKQAEIRRRELEEMDRKWAQAAAEQRALRREQQQKIEAEKKAEAEKNSRERAERIAKYNRLAKEAAAEGDTATAACWRRLAVEELAKYTNGSTNRF